MNKILSWQEPKGCYADDRQPFLKLSGFVGPASSPPPKDREVCMYQETILVLNCKGTTLTRHDMFDD